MTWRAAILALLLAVASWPAQAAPRPELGPYRRFAIVIGSSYGAPDDVPLRFARKDAETVAQTLRELGGVRAADLTLLLDPRPEAVRRAFADVVGKLTAAPGPALLVVYYSGHADGTALHLGPGTLPWSELAALVRGSPASLKVGIVDACQAGSLTAAKGLTVAPPLAVSPDVPTGTALVVAASSVEAAQESLDLGGSVFTHYLISALRGGADADGDGLVTLAEAHAYATRHTQAATAAWAPQVQHPRFAFDLEGHGEVVLTDLSEGAARATFAAPLEGHVVVTERQSQGVLVEARKRAGQALTLALPAGRYQVHLRRHDAIFVAELELPWGGAVALDQASFSRHSYQEVAMKGGVVELHQQRLRLGVTTHAGVLPGLGPVPGLSLSWGWKLGEFELGVRGRLGARDDAAVDTTVHSRVLGAGLTLTYERPSRVIDWRAGVLLDLQVWRQTIDLAPTRQSAIPGLALTFGVRVPLGARLFTEVGVEAGAWLPRLDDGRVVRAAAGLELALGWVY
jgi:hypothetical protein